MPSSSACTPRRVAIGGRPGAVVLADNIKTFRVALAPYVEYVQSGRNGYRSVTLPLKDGFEYSVRLAS